MLSSPKIQPGLLFASFLYRHDLHDSTLLKKDFLEQFGEGFTYVPSFNPLNTYYSREMGSDLSRFFLVATAPLDRSEFVPAKLRALCWESEHLREGKRTVNIDTGFISAENFILATTKNYSHRIFLESGIFAELTYQFRSSTYEPLPWTYPDYQDPAKVTFLTWCRSFLLQKLAFSIE